MNTSIVMPKVGLTMTEGKIVEWRKQAGERVEKDEVIFVFETEKVTFEFESPSAGTLTSVTAELGDVVAVGTQIAMLVAGEATSTEAPSAACETPAPEPAAVAATPAPLAAAVAPPAATNGKVRATPLARRLAAEAGISLEQLAAQSGGQRLRAQDVRAAQQNVAATQVTAPIAAPVASVVEITQGDRVVPLSGMRRIIAERMLAAKTQTAATYMTLSADVSRVMEARWALMDMIEAERGVRPTLTDFFLKICAAALAKHPVLNARWSDDGVVWLDRIHMGMATALDEGLIVPVITDIETKSIGEVAVARQDLATRARAGQLLPEEMHGSTFTLSSLGMFGVEEFTSNLNLPEAGILAVGAIIETPVVVSGEVVIRPMMKVTLTYDHRIVDGAKAGAFMQTLKAMLENPILVIA